MKQTLQTLHKVAEAAKDLIFVIDSELLIQYANHSTSQSLARPAKAMIGEPFEVVFPQNGHQVLKENLMAMFDSGQPFSAEHKISRHDQAPWFETSFTPIRDESGTIRGALGIGRDVTQRKEREETIARSRREWLRAIDAMPYLLAVINNRHRFERVNKAMAEKLGVSVKEAVGLSCHDRLHGVSKPPPFCPLVQLMPDGCEHTLLTLENHLKSDYIVSLSSLKDREGRVIGCVYMARDMAEPEQMVAVKPRREEFMKLLMRSAEYLVFIQNRKGKYIFCSASPSEGVRPSEIIGKTPHDFFDPQIASIMMERVRQVAKTRKELNQPIDLECNGEAFQFHERISPVKDAGGHVRAVVTVSRKIREGKPSFDDIGTITNSTQSLTTREREILQLIATGLTNRQIGEKLGISPKTVETHRSRIMRKLDLHKTSALVRFAVKSGLF